MIEPSFIDDIDTDFCGDFFNHIDDLLDFPTEDVEIEGGIGSECCNGSFQDIAWQPPPEPVTLVSNSGNKSTAGTSELPTELSVPYEDIAQLEWLSNFVEDSFSAGSITLEKEDESSDKKKDFHHFHSSSPVSVLETSSSYTGEKTIFRGRPRSKRPRPASFHPPAIPFILPSSPEFENFTESYPRKKIVKFVVKEDKKKKSLSLPIGVMDEKKLALTEPILVRKCMHCEITKTPQWRAGPMGPKTLCNACGVRYKSGRLFPEYRPAASPTFVESLHSCSHKKVLEMRKTVMDETTLITVPISEFSA